jgi:hypothetical protein
MVLIVYVEMVYSLLYQVPAGIALKVLHGMVTNVIEEITNNVKEDGYGIQSEDIVHILKPVELINNGMVSDADANKASTM